MLDMFQKTKALVTLKKAEKFLMLLVTVLSSITSWYAISNYQLNEKTVVAEISAQFDNTANQLILKNYGKVAGSQFSLLGAQIEFAEKPSELNIFRGGTDYIYPNEDISFFANIMNGAKDRRAQFLILVWRYHNGKTFIIKNRVLVRTPSEPYWVSTIQPFVDNSQWDYLSNKKNKMENDIIQRRDE
ncbi:hypothetical protein OMAG_001164 [Candidatus Omnitrophus magneticus]|uniref:Uncharacterized protein n=1 Tax=Candidatus Omnitrophus magneticus TaxID=1609969 RepID=A0A0F0CSE6_9BACT|nr:hypothetical protein OMAG_001164 [Candidatus Omnitrophus magneticus]